jgi:hypothetical protein
MTRPRLVVHSSCSFVAALRKRLLAGGGYIQAPLAQRSKQGVRIRIFVKVKF